MARDWSSDVCSSDLDTGQFWGRLNEYVRGNCPQVKMSYIFEPCQHCNDARCIGACRVEGGIYRRTDGLVVIDVRKCTGCRDCITACPYDRIFFNDNLNLAQKCTGCAHLLDKGSVFKEPRCVDACATGALKFGEETDFKSLIPKAEILHPEYGLSPRVYYLNLPKKFIAGTVYIPGIDEVVVGATCTLTGGGETHIQKTNDWGDFWFDGLKTSVYSLKVEADEKSKIITNISTERDVGLGDIALI
jgi:tetrathionate reductase subunit B